ncbi:MAG: hypothetical protein JWO91_3293, partial [Acidobacteriaceae bacterium]|nr:hypothetical protein [Acidobacteriaceae bacterium]
MSAKQIFALIGSFAITALLAISAAAQSNISGDVTGIITDPSGAVLPNVPVTLTNNDTGVTRTTNSNGAGVYRFSLLEPGKYTVSASPQGFQEVKRAVTIAVGQANTVNLQMAVAGGAQTVEVSAEGVVLQTEGGNISTTFTPEQVSQMPNPGNDLTFIVQTAPGAVMNTQSGYGNEAIYGLPGTSNLFTVDGENENDPFLNLNNSGATNLLLGSNDIQEVTVVSNGYQAQYGQLGGANVNYVTKSGTNKFHGNAEYFWNGSFLNANDWFANHTSPKTPRPFDNANQWAASFGGPIRKNKTFFFADTEGLRFVLPSVISTNIPSPQFEAATLANVAGTSPAQAPFYTNMFNLYNGAVGANRAANILPNGTDSVTGAPTGPGCVGFSPFANATTPCALQFQSTAPNQSNEWLLTARVDQNFGSNDRMFVHFRTDHGSQATYTDSINPIFNALSKQPQYEGQLNETHTFSGNMVNQFILAGSWYSAIFSTANLGASLATFPYTLRFSGQAFTTLGGEDNVWPQGRNVTQYQISDQLSVTHGRHNLAFGVDFRRNDITDHDPSLGSVGLSSGETLSNFFSGAGTTYTQNFPTRLTQPIALYTLGLFAQDTWSVRPNLKVTLALRAEHDSNPICTLNCFARFNTSFTDIPHDPNQPYNQVLRTGFRQALPNYTNIAWEPRFGFAWTPLGTGSNTVIRGGVGIFRDVFPATVADNFIRNPPVNNAFSVGTGALDPAVPGSQPSTAAASNSAFISQYSTGGTLASISAAVPAFVPPTLFNPDRTIHYPLYEEWNLQLQQGLGQRMSFAIGYVGNHGIYEPVINDGQNAYCNVTPLPFVFSAATTPCAAQLLNTTGFRGLPFTPLDP